MPLQMSNAARFDGIGVDRSEFFTRFHFVEKLMLSFRDNAM